MGDDSGTYTLETCAKQVYDELFNSAIENSWVPGEHFYYGPGHLQVAGAMALNASGAETFNKLFRASFADELNLSTSTAYLWPSLTNPQVAAGATCSASDYGSIMSSFMRSEIISLTTFDDMVKDRTPEDSVTFEYKPLGPPRGQDWHYASGCWRECREDPYSQECDDTIGVISSVGAFGFYPMADFDRNAWGVVATQGSSARESSPLGQEWLDMFVAANADSDDEVMPTSSASRQ